MAEKKIDYPIDPNFIGRNIYLRPCTAEDVANTYHWFLQSDPSLQSRLPLPFKTPAEAAEDYRKMEKSSERQLFVVVRKKDNQPVGVTRFFNWNSLNRSVELGIVVDPEELRNGYGIEAVRLLSRFLFRMRDLNRIHAMTSELNAAAVGMLEAAGFKREGVLRHNHFYNGEFHDSFIYAILRYEFEQ